MEKALILLIGVVTADGLIFALCMGVWLSEHL